MCIFPRLNNLNNSTQIRYHLDAYTDIALVEISLSRNTRGKTIDSRWEVGN